MSQSFTHAHTHTGLLILQPDGWIEQTRLKKNKTKIKIAMSNI